MVQAALTIAAAGLLFSAACVTMVRLRRGPTLLDRVLALDVLISIAVCALGLEAAVNRHATTLPIMIALSLVGFVGSVSVARFLGRDRDDEKVRP